MYDNHEVDEDEYTTTLPKMYAESVPEQDVTIGVSAHGGGTVGESYADNGWTYRVMSDGKEILSGDDLRSGGTPATHDEMTHTLANFLSADAESIRYGSSEDVRTYSPEQRAFLEAEGERFSLFGLEPELENQLEAE